MYPLHMVIDHKTEMYVKFAKVMLIFQGPDTDKRADLVEQLISKFKYAGFLISDKTYKKETNNPFVQETAAFHEYFRSRVKKACEEGYNLIIIDQSISNTTQIQYYMFLAQVMQYVVFPFPPLVTGRRSINSGPPKSEGASFKNQISVFNMLETPNLFQHHFCAWFFHDIDSFGLREEANLYFKDCYENIREFEDVFKQYCKPEEFNMKYNLLNKRQDLAYCLVSILKGEVDSNNYLSSEDFKKNYGKASKLYIVGFIISNHTISARVKLTYNQRSLWTLEDEIDEERRQTLTYPSDLLKNTKIHMPEENITLISSKSNRTIETGETTAVPLESIRSARSCHIRLGKTENAPIRNINYDVPFAVFRERKVVQKYPDKVLPYDLERSVVRRIGKYWFIYLKESIVVRGFFSTCCSAMSNVV